MNKSHHLDIHIGMKLRAIRLARGFSQQTLAKKIGLSYQQLQKYERGASKVSASRLYELANMFDISVIYLYKGLKLQASSSQRILFRGMQIRKSLKAIQDKKLKQALENLICLLRLN